MRVAVVHSFYTSANPSGENQVVLDQCAALERAGHEVIRIFVSTDDLSGSALYGLRSAWNVATGSGYDVDDYLRVAAPDIVHVHNLFPNISSRWMSNWRERVVVTLHNYRAICAAATLHRDGRTCHKCPSSSSIWSVRHGCYRDSPVATLPLMVATRSAGRHGAYLKDSAARILLNEDARDTFQSFHPELHFDVLPNFSMANAAEPCNQGSAYVFAGRLTEEKGILDLLRSWPNTENLLIYGTGPLEKEVERIATRAANIVFAGKQSHEIVLASVAGARALVVPSKWSEGIPTVLIEALAAGTPLLLSHSIAVSKELVDAGAAVGFHPADARSLKFAISEIGTKVEQLRKNASIVFLENYSEERWSKQISDLYSRVLNSQNFTHWSV